MKVDDPVVLEALDLERFPPGRIGAAWLPVLEDAFGEPIRLPLLVARGVRPGPVLGLTASVHGDELNGIFALHRLFAGLDPKRLAGTVVAVVVSNPVAFHARSRRLDERWDLNHLFPGKRVGHGAHMLAQRLRRHVVQSFDFLLDLHTASRGRVNSLYVRADMTSPVAARLAYLQHPQIIVHNPPSDGTLRGAAASLGIPAITVEIGDPQRFQPAIVRRAVTGLRRVLVDLGMIAPSPRAEPIGPEPIVCASSTWSHTTCGGLLHVRTTLAARVRKGDEVARLVDVFGRHREVFHAAFDGVVVGHAVDPVAPTGSRIVHLGREATPEDPILHREEVLAGPPPGLPEDERWNSSSS